MVPCQIAWIMIVIQSSLPLIALPIITLASCLLRLSFPPRQKLMILGGVINEKCSASLRPNAEPCVSVMTDMFHLVGGGGDQYAEEMFQKGETGIDFLFFILSSCLEFSACAVFKPQLSHFCYYNIP